MFASSPGSLAKRRGIVLVVVLGMLGLMALIGVTFATFAGQSLIASRNFGQGVARPQAEALMDYALAQLINDTNNPVSAIRGHSLLRDMYGNDSVYRGSNPPANPAAETGGVLASVYSQTANNGAGGYVPLQMSLLGPRVNSNSSPSPTPFYNQVQFQTNIPAAGQYYGLDFTRWIVKVQGAPANIATSANGYASQTFEILEDDASSGYHKFTFSNNIINPTIDVRNPNGPAVPSDWATFLYVDPNFMSPNGVQMIAGTTPAAYSFTKAAASLSPEWLSNTVFTLDGRNMRAFNGPGLTSLAQRVVNGQVIDVYPYNFAAYGNFRINGLNPDTFGMDEDYDACDLENWFLAIQSADGQVVVPSFHRPGILMAADWSPNASVAQISKILRPRQADNSPLFPADPAFPDSNGKLTYDIDNDGDGVTDSVWVDLGYSVQRDPGGKLYKPLFAFMVLGLNGRLPLNTVGNLHARANADTTNNVNAPSPLGTPLPSTTGQVSQPGILADTNAPAAYYKPVISNFFFGQTIPSSQTYLDAPLWDHASHLGYSVNEINPKYALQNAPSNVYLSTTSASGSAIGPNVNGNNFSQVDNAGVSVALTQMRNILAGTIPTDIPYPVPPSKYPITTGTYPNEANQDVNVVMVNGQYMVLPNNMADPLDIVTNGINFVFRNLQPVAGRWGEPSGILANSPMPVPGSTPYGNPAVATNPIIVYPGLIYNNPVRAGRSIYVAGTNDIMDDDFDGTDPVLSSYNVAMLYYFEPTLTGSQQVQVPSSGNLRNLPELADNFDTIGQRSVASERARHFVTPYDPGGVGRVVDFMNRPNNDYDYGRGYDGRGRAGYFRYFRTPGMPQDIRYPYGGAASTYTNYPYTPTSGATASQRFLMPQLYPAGSLYAYYNPPTTTNTSPPGTVSSAGAPTGASDIHSNRYHGFQSMLTPEYVTGATPASYNVSIQDIASSGAMPYDWDSNVPAQPNGNSGPGVPAGYPNGVGTLTTVPVAPATTLPTSPPIGTNYVNNFAPTLNPSSPVSSVNTNSGPNFGYNGNPGQTTVSPMLPMGYGGYQQTTDSQPPTSPVVNGYLGGVQVNLSGNIFVSGGGLNKDEADEMNLYAPNSYDMPYGPSDLEWLYRLQDVDGATLDSRLAKLAPVSFLNAADGLTRRRLFSTDSWEPTGWVYANDNPFPYAGAAYGNSTDHSFAFNSRFTSGASPSLEIMNQIDGFATFPNGYAGLPTYFTAANNPAVMANPITTEYLPNPTFPTISGNQSTSYGQVIPNSGAGAIALPTFLDTASGNLFDKPQIARVLTSNGVLVNGGFPNTMAQVQTPALAHRDRRINLNYPLPISNDPGEPVRQKWCRETYTLLKAILPPSSVDTPEELAGLSQFVVNIIDFRDPDCTMTRFVNTDLIVTDVLTKTASNILQPSASASPPYYYDTTWNVTPAGVRFANATDAANYLGGHFPYDPSIYSPDATTPFLVQHGMEYNPIAINEVLGVQFQYNSAATGSPPTLTSISSMYIELVNTLTEEQNGNAQTYNASAISLAGWDLVIAPDNYGWGRPDPISGDVTSIAYPPFSLYNGATTAAQPQANSQQPLSQVNNFQLSGTIKAINAGAPNYFVVGTNPTGTPFTGNGSNTLNNPSQGQGLTLPNSFLPTTVAPQSGTGQYFWLYLRRPANPFDTGGLVKDSTLSTYKPNREMVVVDAMRFPFIDAGRSGVSGAMVTSSPNTPYSARRLQPYRGGHLLPVATVAGTAASTIADGTTASVASGITTICPPSPAYAYGYSEQMSPASGGTVAGTGTSATNTSTKKFAASIGTEGTPKDTAWAHFPFNDRDFTSVAELLLVPGCPPGLFTKQFVEEPYPGNVVDQQIVVTQTYPMTQPTGNNTSPVTYSTAVTNGTTYAAGVDNSNFTANSIAPPTVSTTGTANAQSGSNVVSTTTITTNPVGGRKDFNELPGITAPIGVGGANLTISSPPIAPTFPYLPDNFYYTAASVAPPTGNYPSYYTNLTTEIGGWTGNGWHKMMEFFEVPSSANGAVGTADTGFNFDWARQDTKPGLLNLNLIIDEEVFAGLFDDPRLNERLAAYAPGSSTLPQIVTQIDGNGYAAARYPIFNLPSINQLSLPLDGGSFVNGNNAPAFQTGLAGRGYVVRDPDSQNYTSTAPNNYFPYQQLHGIKAAFSDFLKLRHGGSGHLFAHGAGPTGSGDVQPNLNLAANLYNASQPIAADRPYRSLSYPDINYTVMRPASLPPSLVDTNVPLRWTATTPALPPALAGLFSYSIYAPGNSPGSSFVELSLPIAPRNTNLLVNNPGTPFQYVADPGVKNPYLPVQYANPMVPDTGGGMAASEPPTVGVAGPPYPSVPFSTLVAAYPPPTNPNPAVPPYPIPPAPFPPPIPPTPAARLVQVPDLDTTVGVYPGVATSNGTPGVTSFSNVAIPQYPTSNSSVAGQHDGTIIPLAATPTAGQLTTDGLGNAYPAAGVSAYAVNWPVSTMMLYNGATFAGLGGLTNPPTLVPPSRAVFLQDNNTPLAASNSAPQTSPPTNNTNYSNLSAGTYMVQAAAQNYLGAGTPTNVNINNGGVPTYANYATPTASGLASTTDYRQHPLYRTEWLQKIMNLTTVRTHQFAVWITIGFFEVVKPGTPELGLPDILGQELGITAGKNIRYRSFFVLDRTKATGFNPYYPGNFRDCVTYRRRIE